MNVHVEKIKIQTDVLAVAERVLATERGPFSTSVYEIEALAHFVVWAEQFVPKNQMKKVTKHGYSK